MLTVFPAGSGGKICGYDTKLHLRVRLQFWRSEECRLILYTVNDNNTDV